MTKSTTHDHGPGILNWNVCTRVLTTIAAILLIAAVRADAARVTGVYAGPHDKPLADHQLHFENIVSGDIFITHTGSDGSFSADLPPGTYDLRAEHGLIIKSKIVVQDSEVSVGHVGSTTPIEMIRRPFESQSIAPVIVDTSAPSTAHVAAPSGTGGYSSDATPPQSAATFYTPGTQASAPPPTAH